jgi:hypothetical protein
MAKGTLALQMLVVVAVLGAAGSALAQRTYVVTDLRYDDDGRLGTEVTETVFSRSDFDAFPTGDLRDELDMQRVSTEELFADPDLVREVAEQLYVNVFVTGELDDARSPQEITLVVYDGATGRETQRFYLSLDRDGFLDQPDNDGTFDELVAHMGEVMDAAASGTPWGSNARGGGDDDGGGRGGRAGRGGDDGGGSGGRRGGDDSGGDGGGGRRSGGRESGAGRSNSSGLGLADAPDEDDAPWLRVQAGLDVIRRSFKLADAANNGIQYESGFRPGVEAMVQLFPVAAFAPGAADGLSISVRVARYFIDTQLQDENGIVTIPTRHKELGLALSYAHAFGPLELMGSVGYERSQFILGANPVYPSSSYSGVAIGLGLRYHIVEDFLSLAANGEVRPSPTFGDEEQAVFGAGTGLGIGVAAEARFLFFDHLEVAGGYALRTFSADFDGTGTNPLDAVTSTDTYNHLGVRISYLH